MEELSIEDQAGKNDQVFGPLPRSQGLNQCFEHEIILSQRRVKKVGVE